MTAQRIGFVDCDLDNFHANVYLEALRGPLSDRGDQIVGATADPTDANRAWCEMKSVRWFDSIIDRRESLIVRQVLDVALSDTAEDNFARIQLADI